MFKFKKVSKIRHYFSVAVLAALVLTLLYMATNPLKLEKFVATNIGRAVGLSLSVSENPYNTLALELQKKEERINAREKDLEKIQEDLKTSYRYTNWLILVLGASVVLLFFLVLLNFYFDYRRRKREEIGKGK